ncbi:hypothetical protein OG244_38940 [Streptomyces brevispora]|uniref:hypothetical protein n=1 Tax=Streptomyces brevispora TaxID=887462 RepID=UPI002E36F249|nr:hypothetical protein [Streptomyces brevispora]
MLPADGEDLLDKFPWRLTSLRFARRLAPAHRLRTGMVTGADGRFQVQAVMVQVGQEEQGQGAAGVAGVLDVGLFAGPAERGLVGSGVYAGGVRVGEDDGAGEEVVQAAHQVRIRVLRLTSVHGGGGVLQDGGQVPPAGLLHRPAVDVVRQQSSARVLRIGPLRHDPVADLRLLSHTALARLTPLLRLAPAMYVRVAVRGVGLPPVLGHQSPDALQLVAPDRCQPVLRAERLGLVLPILRAASGHPEFVNLPRRHSGNLTVNFLPRLKAPFEAQRIQ